MHRSGTSSLAGSLEEAGLFLGDVRGRGQWNRKGNRESKVLMQMHEDVLRANGGNWRRPPERVAWAPEHKARRDRYIADRVGRSVWGFKDPRSVFVLDGWLDAIPDLEMVASVRHPMAVARSLQRRSGSDSVDPWLGLWLAYDRKLLELHAQHGFPIIDFDLPADQYQARLAALIDEMGLHAPERESTFFEDALRNPTPEDAALPDEVETVYRELRAIAARSVATTPRESSA